MGGEVVTLLQISGMWIATWSVIVWVPKGRGMDRGLFKDLQQAGRISSPPTQLSHSDL